MTPRKNSSSSMSTSVSAQSAQMLDALLQISGDLQRILERIEEVVAIARRHNSDIEEMAQDLRRIAQRATGSAESEKEMPRIETPSSIRTEPPPFAGGVSSKSDGDDSNDDNDEDLVPIL